MIAISSKISSIFVPIFFATSCFSIIVSDKYIQISSPSTIRLHGFPNNFLPLLYTLIKNQNIVLFKCIFLILLQLIISVMCYLKSRFPLPKSFWVQTSQMGYVIHQNILQHLQSSVSFFWYW